MLQNNRTISNEGGSRLLASSGRFSNDFVSLGQLGNGGFGAVVRYVLCWQKTLLLVPCTQCHRQAGVRGQAHSISTSRRRGRMHESKTLFDGNAKQPQVVKVLREVHTMALLSHPNVVRYYSAWCEMASVADDDHAAATHATYDERYTRQRGIECVWVNVAQF